MPAIILPTPDYKIDDTGSINNTTGTAGPGFASVKLSASFNSMSDRTNSGRLLTRSVAYHLWNISISYNPMTRAQFDPVFSFLMSKRGGLLPFQVELPQYRYPKDVTFSTFVNAGSPTFTATTTAATENTTTLRFTGSAGYSNTSNSTPKPGDIFNLASTIISNLYKTYMVTGVSLVDANKFDLTFSPGLEKTLVSAGTVYGVFKEPKFRVVMSKDLQDYSLNTENLYSFGLELEEALA